MNESTSVLTNKRIWVVGHRGMVGSAIARRLEQEHCHILTVSRDSLDLRRQEPTEAWIKQEKPDLIFLAAATVGGIWANDTRPAEFIYDNLMIEANVIHTAWKCGVEKLLFLGSSCIYPKLATQPMHEDALLSGALEPTNQWYAIAKIAGVKLCQAYRKQYGCNFISAMPTNLYGPNDNFHPEFSHVIPALLRKIHIAKINNESTTEIWGSGTPRREFLYVEDLADALVFLMQHYSGDEHVNVGTGKDISIAEVAELIANIVGYSGSFSYNTDKPDGTPRKLLNVDKLNQMGWTAKTDISHGLKLAYDWFVSNKAFMNLNG